MISGTQQLKLFVVPIAAALVIPHKGDYTVVVPGLTGSQRATLSVVREPVQSPNQRGSDLNCRESSIEPRRDPAKNHM